MESTACPECGRRLEEAAARFCPGCGAVLGAGRAPEPPGNTVPFEDTSRPFLSRLLATAGLAFSDPMHLFSGLQRGDIGPPLVYGLIVGTLASLAAMLWQIMFGGLAMIAEGMDAGEFAFSTGLYVLFMFLSPVLAALGLFVSSGIFHLALLILGDGQRGFSVTFRAVAYGNTPGLLGIVPFCGGIVGGIWALVLVIIGGKLGHGTDWWRAILAYFLPVIACCCLAAWLAATLGLFGALAN